jgi:hypothetical protein
MGEVPGSAVPCAIRFRDLGLALLHGGRRSDVLTELMPALEMALASSSELTEEEVAITSELSKQLSVLDKTVEEKQAKHLIAARAHLKAVPAPAGIKSVHTAKASIQASSRERLWQCNSMYYYSGVCAGKQWL